ncbi:hypothetical protein FQN54_003413 [Arachnomyces sp. PD_36]|nr:hypothetical protein FQN54_003413 [Arachnomyces sp. PD_36]
MQLFKTLFAGAALIATAAAQGRLRFTSFTPSVEVGDPVTITWAGGMDAIAQPVTIKLRQGESTNLEDVAVLTSTGTGGSYTWIPDTTLPEATNYALQINQGDDINYTGLFAIKGGSPAAPTTVTTATAVPTTTEVSDSSSYSVTPSSGSPTTSLTPSSTLVTSSSFETETPSGDSSTTTVNPTKTPTGSSTTTGASPTATGGAASMASPLALVLGIVAAVVYLN